MSKEKIERHFNKMLMEVKIGNIPAAIEIVQHIVEHYPSNLDDSLYWSACLYSLNGDLNKVIECFDKAISKGIWWSTDIINKESDFDNVRNSSFFIEVNKKMQILQSKTINNISSYHVIVKNNLTDQFVINLHWKNDKVDNYRKHFDEIYEKSNTNAIYIQSSEIESSKGYSWNSYGRACEDIERELDGFEGKIITISGTSQGGRIALKYAIDNGYDFVGIMPAIITTEIDINPKISYSFIIGDQDYFYKNVVALHTKLLSLGISSKLVIMESVGHYFPENFEVYYKMTTN